MSQARYGVAPSINLARTKMQTSYDLETTFLHGKLIPLDMIPIIPGSSFKVDLTSYIRMSDPIVPIFGNITVGIHAFFVPWRLVWNHTEEFFGANKTSSGPQTTEYVIPKKLFKNIKEQSVADYLGYPLIGNASGVVYRANVLKERCYCAIWNDWYRPQQVANPFIIDLGDSGENFKVASRDGLDVLTSMDPIEVAKKFDIFTAGTLSPQYGDPVEISFTNDTTADVVLKADPNYEWVEDGSNLSGPTFRTIGNLSNIGLEEHGSEGGNLYNAFNQTAPEAQKIAQITTDANGLVDTASDVLAYDPAGTLKVDLSSAVMTDVRTLRFAFAMQRYLEALNFGSRYFEILQNIYGTTNPDARLQRPEHIGQIHFPIQVQQVLSTAGAEAGETSKLGQAGANSVTLNRNILCSKGFTEFGYLCIMLDTKHDRVYSQGLKREDFVSDRFDIFAPQFDHVGDMSIENRELFIQSEGGPNTNKAIFGYQEAWYNERYRESRVSGFLNPNSSNMLAPYSLAEAWENRPTLSWDFLKEDRTNIARVLKTGVTGPDYLANFHIKLTMVKPMSAHSLPGLIDHVGRF